MPIGTKLALLLKKDFVTNIEMIEARNKLHTMMDVDDNRDRFVDILEKVIHRDDLPNPVMMSNDTISDMQLDEWCKEQCYTQGGKKLFHRMLTNPTCNQELLRHRQILTRKALPKWEGILQKLSVLENDMLWMYGLPPHIHDVWPLPMLFPSMIFLRRINNSDIGLQIYHLCRIWLAPMFQIAMPILGIIGPWLYLRYRIGWKIGLVQYFKMVKFVIQQSMADIEPAHRTGRILTLFMYGFMFMYGIVQAIDVSRMLYAVRKSMMLRINNIREFVNGAYDLVSAWNPDGIHKPIIPGGMAGVYAIWLNTDLRNSISLLMKRFYELDVHLSCRLLVDREKWCYAMYKPSNNGIRYVCHSMRNPLLSINQTSNPACLIKNIIITGPNAAGKSTYVRSIGANLVCAQSLGICCARRMILSPVDAILSYMRVRDTIGTASLFETEVSNCSKIIELASSLQSDGKQAVIFFDEPMHSTPPLEGEATAYAVLEHLGNMPNIRTIVTSHYHKITELSKDRWINLSMDAHHDTSKDIYTFPYMIRNGPSFQSIAIELLRGTGKLPASVVQNALKFKSAVNKSDK